MQLPNFSGSGESSFCSLELIENSTINCAFHIETTNSEITCVLLDKDHYTVQIYINDTLYSPSSRKATVQLQDIRYKTLVFMNVTEIAKHADGTGTPGKVTTGSTGTTGTTIGATTGTIQVPTEKQPMASPKEDTNNYNSLWYASSALLLAVSLFGYYKTTRN